MKFIGILLVLGIATFGLSAYVTKGQKQAELANKSFDERLERILILTENKYKSSNRDFGINFSHGRMVIFQMIKSSLLENSKTRKIVNLDTGFICPLTIPFQRQKGNWKNLKIQIL